MKNIQTIKEKIVLIQSIEKVLIDELENSLLYEIQHIPFYQTGQVQYFEHSILEKYLNEGSQKLFENINYKPVHYIEMPEDWYNAILVYAAYLSTNHIVNDIETQNPLPIAVWGIELDKTKEIFNLMKNNYKKMFDDIVIHLKEINYDMEKNEANKI